MKIPPAYAGGFYWSNSPDCEKKTIIPSVKNIYRKVSPLIYTAEEVPPNRCRLQTELVLFTFRGFICPSNKNIAPSFKS